MLCVYSVVYSKIVRHKKLKQTSNQTELTKYIIVCNRMESAFMYPFYSAQAIEFVIFHIAHYV